jgi:hypothetical protein
MRRTFWIGVGAAGTVLVLRWMRRQRARLSPEAVGATVGEGLRDLGQVVRASLAEGRKAMRDKEAELRASLEEHD